MMGDCHAVKDGRMPGSKGWEIIRQLMMGDYQGVNYERLSGREVITTYYYYFFLYISFLFV